MDYVFHIYKGADHKVYSERLKVVYENQTYIYCKKHGSDTLLCCRKDNIYKDTSNLNTASRYLDEFVLDVSPGFTELQKNMRILVLKDFIKNCRKKLEDLDHQKFRLLNEINEYSNELACLEPDKKTEVKE